MMRIVPTGAALLLALGSAQAQPVLTGSAAPTVLTLSAAGSTAVNPDQIVASLNVQSSSATAARAQAAVNREMKQALGAANSVAGVTATTGDYSVDQNNPDTSANPRPGYQASQDLQLMMAAPGVPPPAFTALVGRLQGQGLLLNTLDGDLSDAGQAAAQQAAIDDAIRQIQAQAAAVAAVLGERVGKIQSLNVNVNAPGPVMRAASMMLAAAPPPQAVFAKVTIQASVNATILLRPTP
jgi:uncharacterized protein YggE